MDYPQVYQTLDLIFRPGGPYLSFWSLRPLLLDQLVQPLPLLTPPSRCTVMLSLNRIRAGIGPLITAVNEFADIQARDFHQGIVPGQ